MHNAFQDVKLSYYFFQANVITLHFPVSMVQVLASLWKAFFPFVNAGVNGFIPSPAVSPDLLQHPPTDRTVKAAYVIHLTLFESALPSVSPSR